MQPAATRPPPTAVRGGGAAADAGGLPGEDWGGVSCRAHGTPRLGLSALPDVGSDDGPATGAVQGCLPRRYQRPAPQQPGRQPRCGEH